MIKRIRERKLITGVAVAAILSGALLIWLTRTSTDDNPDTSEATPPTTGVSTTEPKGSPVTTQVEGNSAWAEDSSQTEDAATRDGVNPTIAQLSFEDRVDSQASVNAGGRRWVLSELPTDTRNQLIDDGSAGADFDPFGGEVLILADDEIVRAFPMNEFPPTFLDTDGTLVYAGRIGDGGYPDSALMAINALTLEADKIVMRSAGSDSPSFYGEKWEEGTDQQLVALKDGNYLVALRALTGSLASGDAWVVRDDPERGICVSVADINYGCDDEAGFLGPFDPPHTPRFIATPVPPEGIDSEQIGVIVYGYLAIGATQVELRDSEGGPLESEKVVNTELGLWAAPVAVASDGFSVSFLDGDGTLVIAWPG